MIGDIASMRDETVFTMSLDDVIWELQPIALSDSPKWAARVATEAINYLRDYRILLKKLGKEAQPVNKDTSTEDKEREKLVNRVVDDMGKYGGLIIGSEAERKKWLVGILQKSGMMAENEKFDDAR